MGCPTNQKVFTIFTGDEKTIFLKALFADNLNPLSLVDCTEIDIALPNADGTFTHLLYSEDDVAIVTPAVLGKFSALIISDESLLLNPGLLQNFDVTFTIGSDIITVPYLNALSVIER